MRARVSPHLRERGVGVGQRERRPQECELAVDLAVGESEEPPERRAGVRHLAGDDQLEDVVGAARRSRGRRNADARGVECRLGHDPAVGLEAQEVHQNVAAQEPAARVVAGALEELAACVGADVLDEPGKEGGEIGLQPGVAAAQEKQCARR